MSVVLLLGACGDDGALAKENLSDYPESVQDGTVSVEYYKQIQDFYEESIHYLEEITDSESNVEHLSKVLSEYNKALLSYTAEPKLRQTKKLISNSKRLFAFKQT